MGICEDSMGGANWELEGVDSATDELMLTPNHWRVLFANKLKLPSDSNVIWSRFFNLSPSKFLIPTMGLLTRNLTFVAVMNVES